MELRLFTLPDCPNCPMAKEVAETVVKQRGDITLAILDVSNQDNMTLALMMQIASTPSFTIDETPIFMGVVPSISELNAKIDAYKRGIHR